MSLYETLMTWPPERLAKELQGQARDNAALRRRVLVLEEEVFWLKAIDRDGALLASNGPATASSKATMPASDGFGVVTTRPRTPTEAACWCSTCRPVTLDDCRMMLCPACGNKRCPHANDHRNACSGSNAPGQPGSAYPCRPVEGGDDATR